MKKAIIGLFCFVIAGASAFFGIEFITKTGFFKEPGELLFSEDFSESEKEHYQEMNSEEMISGQPQNPSFNVKVSDSLIDRLP